eukprot:4838669-Amphidinium_carterae.1
MGDSAMQGVTQQCRASAAPALEARLLSSAMPKHLALALSTMQWHSQQCNAEDGIIVHSWHSQQCNAVTGIFVQSWHSQHCNAVTGILKHSWHSQQCNAVNWHCGA